MKNYSILKAAICSVFGLALAACADKAEYTPAPQEDSSKTYVRVDDSAPRSLDVDGTDIVVPLIRSNASGALDVTVALEDTSSLFTLNSATISFADGETTANAVVSYSYDSLDPAATYSIAVSITSEGITSEYAPIALPMQCKKAWKKLGTGQYADLFFIGTISEKEFIQSPDGTPMYRMLSPYPKDEVEAAGCTFESELPYIEFTIAEDGSVSWGDNFSTGFGYGGYSIYYANPNWYNGNAEAAAENVLLGENLVQICFTSMAVSGGSIAGSYGTGYALMSLPGGPDLAEVLGGGE